MNTFEIPTLDTIHKKREALRSWLVETPVVQCQNDIIQSLVGNKTEVFLKLELLQKAGSFKARGVLIGLLNLSKDELKRGVVAASAGNHAIAVSFGAKIFGTSAKVIMPRTASPIRIERCRNFGAEVILVESLKEALEKMHEITETEARIPMHPFEAEHMVLGGATLGMELLEQVKNLDAVIIPIGGGGLAAGVSTAVKQIQPSIQVFGAEPEGADAMYRSFLADKPVVLDKVKTIADSLAAPQALPYTFFLCKKFIDEIVRVEDAALVKGMDIFFNEMKLVVEPAAVTSFAALCGPLKEKLQNKRVALIVSGSNIDIDRFCQIIKSAQ